MQSPNPTQVKEVLPPMIICTSSQQQCRYKASKMGALSANSYVCMQLYPTCLQLHFNTLHGMLTPLLNVNTLMECQHPYGMGKWNSRKTVTGAGTENGNGNSYNSLQTIKLPCSVAAEVLCQ